MAPHRAYKLMEVDNVCASFVGAIACKFRHTGQTCVCANRIYVQSTVYADFASKLAEKVAEFRVGNGFDDQTYGDISLFMILPTHEIFLGHTGR